MNIKEVLTTATATHSVDIVFWKATAYYYYYYFYYYYYYFYAR